MPLHSGLLKTLNLVTYIIAVATFVFHDEILQNAYENLPNYLTGNSIGLIIRATYWVLLGGFILTQWLDFAHDVVVDAIDWNFFASNLVMTSWVFTWKYEWYILGQILLIINTILITRLYLKMRVFTATNLLEYAVIYVSFSLYAGMVWFDAFQNFFAAFTNKEGGPMSWAAIGAACAVFFLLVVGNYYAEYSKDPDSWAAATITLTILSISLYQGSKVPVVQITGYVSVGWLVGALIRRVLKNINMWHERSLDDVTVDERRGLLG
ncbi:hypothetical protein BG011_000735 [Mortierella polycephala]|uniref:Uncharacterized protein n=1 Tax=Mortierella polycephala TaxID=41804 RepID=A0A9P6U5Q5_9FUNG|nr:hypothetical protein BG011_000735 [Mortierella polycephala]